MRKQDYLTAGGLSLLAVFIWLRDLAWITSSDDTLPILVALPIFVWLGMPWNWRQDEPDFSLKLFVVGVVLFVVGIGLNLTVLLTAGWAVLLTVWLSARLEPSSLNSYYKLLIFPVMSFPWIALDFTSVGWWFRLSGAWITEYIFSWTGFMVIREGTLLNINGISISIEVACAGLNTLQSMLISGCTVAFLFLHRTARYWLAILVLVVLAWVANTMRIVVICLLALLISPEFVMGPFHQWGGWGVLMLMFVLSWQVFALMEPEKTP